jgi:hypothetical protein
MGAVVLMNACERDVAFDFERRRIVSC